MSLFDSPETHAANPPESWVAVKKADRVWSLQTTNGVELTTAKTKREAQEQKSTGFYVDLYNKEARWYAGENITGWKPYSQIVEERQRRANWLAHRGYQVG